MKGGKANRFKFTCDNCGTEHKEGTYCIAQRASGHKMLHTCDCGNETILEPYN